MITVGLEKSNTWWK